MVDLDLMDNGDPMDLMNQRGALELRPHLDPMDVITQFEALERRSRAPKEPELVKYDDSWPIQFQTPLDEPWSLADYRFLLADIRSPAPFYNPLLSDLEITNRPKKRYSTFGANASRRSRIPRYSWHDMSVESAIEILDIYYRMQFREPIASRHGNSRGLYRPKYCRRGFHLHAMSNTHRSYGFGSTPSDHSHISIAPHSNSLDNGRFLLNSLPNYAASTVFHSLRAMASLNNPSGPDGLRIRIPADDHETARHLSSFITLLPVICTGIYEVSSIFQSSSLKSQPLSIKVSAYLTAIFATAAVVSCLIGLSRTTLEPHTLPIYRNPQPQVELRNIHKVAVHTTAYAFLGAMCHIFLQDDPLIMWTVACLAYAGFAAIMYFFGSRG